MSQKKSSKVWEYYNQLNKKKAECNICKINIAIVDSSTTSLFKHLKTHNIHPRLDKRELEVGFEVECSIKKPKMMMNFLKRSSLEEIISKLAAVDGISIRAITRSEFIRESISKQGFKLPKNESDVMKLINDHFQAIKNKMIGELSEKIQNNVRFSLTIDEWTSTRKKKYVNVNLHGAPNEEPYNLGLVRIFGSCTSTQLLEVVTHHLASFEVNYEQHIVGTTGDGASVMVKFGKECPTFYQLCLSHGVHLAVCDTLYNKESNNEKEEELIDTEDENENVFIDGPDIEIKTTTEKGIGDFVSIHKIIINIRKVIKFFRLSSVRNGILQAKIRAKLGHNLELILDCQSRWSSLANMIIMFVKLQNFIEESLVDLNSSHMLDDIDFNELKDLQNSLEPAKLAIEVLSRNDTTLYSAGITLEYMKSKISNCKSKIALELLENMKKRIDERVNVNLMNLFKALKDPKFVPSKQALDLAIQLLKRLYQKAYNNESMETSEDQELTMVEIQKNLTMKEELDLILKNAAEPPKESEIFSKLKQEFLLFRNTGKRTSNLDDLYNSLSSIKPTSTSNERTFSISCNFCTTVRSRLADKSLNSLVFLKYFYLRIKQRN